MEAFQAYKTYVAIKNHFTSKSYDFFKYGGRTKASRTTFEKRNDKYFFHKLSKRKDVVDYLVANFIYNDSTSWVGDFINNEQSDKHYSRLVKVRESLSYVFSQDLDKLDPDFDSNFQVIEGQHPLLLKKYLQGEINLETLIVLDDLVSFMRKWGRRIDDPVVWPQVYFKCRKYKPFFQYDKEKMKKIVLDKFSKS
jgi:hypothetical protein